MRRLALVFAFLIAPAIISAQTKTQVSGTIVDPSGIPYSNAGVTAVLQPTGISPTVNGAQINGTAVTTTDANGSFSFSLFCNVGPGCTPISPSGTQWKFYVSLSPGVAPPVGYGPVSFTATFTITGASQDLSTGLSAASVPILRGGACSAVSPSTFCIWTPNFGVKYDGHSVVDAVTTINTPTVTSANAHFSSYAKVGQDMYVLNGAGGSACGSPTGVCQIVSIDSDTQVTLNFNSTSSGSGRSAFWSTNDEAAWLKIDAAALAAGLCNVAVLAPAGMSRVTGGHLWAPVASACLTLDGTTGGVALTGQGIKSTLIVPGPDYDYTHTWGANIQAFYPTGIQWNGLGLISANGVNKTLVTVSASSTATRIAVSQINKGVSGFGPAQFGAQGGGCDNCFFDNTNTIGAVANQVVLQKTFSGSGVACTSCRIKSSLGSYGQSLGPGFVLNGTNPALYSSQDTFFNVTGVTTSIELENTALAVVDQGDFSNDTTVSSFFFHTGGEAYVSNSTLAGGAGGAVSTNGGSGSPVFHDQGGNTFSCAGGCTNPIVNFTLGAWTGPGNGNTIYASCAGAGAVGTFGFMGTGPGSATNACATATVGLGVPMNRAGHLAGLIVTATNTGGGGAGDGVVTVTQNGVNTTLTCTLGTATTCRLMPATMVTTALGDLISVKIQYAAGTGISNVRAAVIEIN